MNKIFLTALCILSFQLINSAHAIPSIGPGQTISQTPQDYYWLSCPVTALNGCTLFITTVLNDGSLYTYTDPNVMPGETMNINRVHVVANLTHLVQN